MRHSGKKPPIEKSALIEIGGKKVAIGMHWHVHTKADKKSVEKISSQLKTTFGLPLRYRNLNGSNWVL